MPQASVLKRGQVQNLSCENDFYYHANKTHVHKKGFALRLVLRVRVFGTPKWPIVNVKSRENHDRSRANSVLLYRCKL